MMQIFKLQQKIHAVSDPCKSTLVVGYVAQETMPPCGQRLHDLPAK